MSLENRLDRPLLSAATTISSETTCVPFANGYKSRPARPRQPSCQGREPQDVSNDKGGLWLSLVERFVRDEEVVGSNPASPTISHGRCQLTQLAGISGVWGVSNGSSANSDRSAILSIPTKRPWLGYFPWQMTSMDGSLHMECSKGRVRASQRLGASKRGQESSREEKREPEGEDLRGGRITQRFPCSDHRTAWGRARRVLMGTLPLL